MTRVRRDLGDGVNARVKDFVCGFDGGENLLRGQLRYNTSGP